MGSTLNEPVSVMVDTDIKLPLKTTVSGRGMLIAKGNLEEWIFFK